MTKYALCLSGQFRYVEEAIRKLMDNLIIPYNCDVFIYVSNAKNMTKLEYTKYESNNEIIKLLKDNFKDYLKSYKVSGTDKYIYINSDMNIVEFENTNEFSSEKKAPWELSTQKFAENVSKENFNNYFDKCKNLDMFVHPKNKKEYYCNELKKEYEEKNNFKYDIVLVTRLDIALDNNTFIFENIKDKTIYLYKVWECIYYGNSESIDIAVNKWNLIHDFMIKKYGFNNVLPDIDITIYNNLVSYGKTLNGTGGVDLGLICTWLSRNLKIFNFDKTNNILGIYRNNKNIYKAPTKLERFNKKYLNN